MIRKPPISTRTDTLYPYTTLFRSCADPGACDTDFGRQAAQPPYDEAGSDQRIARPRDARRQAGRAAERRRPLHLRPRRKMKGRSEEHTSELKSLMRISYAVFFLHTQKRTTTI